MNRDVPVVAFGVALIIVALAMVVGLALLAFGVIG